MKKREGVCASESGRSIVYDFYLNSGERRRETIKAPPTAENLDAAEKRMATIQKALSLEREGIAKFDYAQFFPHSKYLKRKEKSSTSEKLGPAMREWLRAQTLKPTGEKGYRLAINELEEMWGEMTVAEFADKALSLVRAWIKQQQDGHHVLRTIRNKLIPLRGTLNAKVEDSTIAYNPLLRLGKIKKPEWEKIRQLRDDEIDPFELEELELLYAKAKPMRRWLIQFLAWSGLRLGEAFALCWEDIDWHRGTAKIYKTRTERRIGTPKTDGSVRVVELLPPALEALKEMKALTSMLPAEPCGDFGEMCFIFCNDTTGKPWMEDQEFRRNGWTTTCRRAGVRYRYPYQLRHTFATICLSAGEDERWIAKQMGHGTQDNPDTTMLRKHYGHWREKIAAKAGIVGGSKVRELTEKLRAAG